MEADRDSTQGWKHVYCQKQSVCSDVFLQAQHRSQRSEAVYPANDRPPGRVLFVSGRILFPNGVDAMTLGMGARPKRQARIPARHKLPCDVRVGHITYKAGVELNTLVEAARRWLAEAQAAHKDTPKIRPLND